MSKDEKQICAYCRYWDFGIPTSSIPADVLMVREGSCCYRAPVSYPETPKFPPMRGSGWCGEFKGHDDDHDPNADIRPWQQIGEIKTSLPEGRNDD